MLNGNTLAIAWNPSVGLITPSATDTINYVIYNGLAWIMLQPTGHPGAREVAVVDAACRRPRDMTHDLLRQLTGRRSRRAEAT